MYHQILKVNEDSVDAYLEDIIKDGIEHYSENIAEEYVLELSDKADQVAQKLQNELIYFLIKV